MLQTEAAATPRSRHRGFPYAPEVVVTHRHPLSLAGFFRLHFQYGQGACDTAVARPAGGYRLSGSSPCLSISTSFATRSRTKAARALQLSALLGVAQLANAAGLFYQSLTARD
jgi:hypothetical protein